MKLYEFNLFRRGTEDREMDTEFVRVTHPAVSDVEALAGVRQRYPEDEWGLVIGHLVGRETVISAGPYTVEDYRYDL